MSFHRGVSAAALGLGLLWACASAAETVFVPFDVDPPIQVDAQLDDWQNVPGAITLDTAEHVTFRQTPWKGPADLSAVIRLAWRSDGLLVAAEVTDDVVQQPFSGENVWKGDYVNLWLDMQPALESERSVLGKGQYHIALSPGNFGTGDAKGGAIPPEAFVFVPQRAALRTARVASRRTEKGYILEAFVPFEELGITDVRQDRYATFELAVSDSDGAPPRQERIMTVGVASWELTRTRLLPMVFADGNGRGVAPDRTIPLAAEVRLKGDEKHPLTFTLDALPDTHQAFLAFRGRADSATPGGYSTRALQVDVNGAQIEEDRLVNRPVSMRMSDGREVAVVTPDGRYTLPWAADYTSTDLNASYKVPGQKVAEFEFALEGLVRTGENRIVLTNTTLTLPDGGRPLLVLGDVELRIRPRGADAHLVAPMPQGELPVYEPITVAAPTYTDLESNGPVIRFKVQGESFAVTSRFSAPDGQWHSGSTSYFTHRREVIGEKEWILVRDTFRNLGPENLPLMYAHRTDTGSRGGDLWLSGHKLGSRNAAQSDPPNPTAFASTARNGVGLVAINDEFRVHIQEAAADGDAEIRDLMMVLRPGVEYTAEWAIVPVPETDYWRFINAARRMLDVNFTLPYLFSFAFGTDPVYKWSDATLRRFIENKSANLIVQSNELVLYKDNPARNTAWMQGPLDPYKDFQTRIHSLYPDRSRKTGVYFHCFLDVYEPNETRFADARVLDANGQHVVYGAGRHAYMKYYVPTLENGFGQEMARWIDTILDEVGADGVYWDEFTYSATPWAYNLWDGCTAEIDPTTMRITRLKGSVTLLSRDWRLKQVERIQARGAPFIINGAPCTRTLARRKMQAFTETGSIAHCTQMHLYAPTALGDHITERTPAHAYRVMMRALDYGCLYAWYTARVFPEYKMITEYMFPFTPVELHSGYVFGRERILTNRSGCFGWGDVCAFDAHVYDREGRETDRYPVKRVERDGRVYAEVRIPGGFSAAIVRRP